MDNLVKCLAALLLGMLHTIFFFALKFYLLKKKKEEKEEKPSTPLRKNYIITAT